MRLTLLPTILTLFSSLSLHAAAQNSTTSLSVIPVLTYLFTVQVNLGSPIGPAPLPGGAAYGVTVGKSPVE